MPSIAEVFVSAISSVRLDSITAGVVSFSKGFVPVVVFVNLWRYFCGATQDQLCRPGRMRQIDAYASNAT